MLLYDYGLSTLEQYNLTQKGTNRIRGALLCQMEEGVFILKEFHGSEKKLMKQQELLQVLGKAGFFTDEFIENKEGKLISLDRDGIAYTLQKWEDGRECDTKSMEDIRKSVAYLAKIHQHMKLSYQPEYMQRSLLDEYARHNQELKKIRKFIRKKAPVNAFEKTYLFYVEEFLRKGEEAWTALQYSEYDSLREQVKQSGTICHGEYHQHNVWFSKNDQFAVNFGHWYFDIQMGDLYHFMRKILEKYNWDIQLAIDMLNEYQKVKPITKEEKEYLKIRFMYPEKFWKIADYYYSHKKVWFSEKNLEKLENVIQQKNACERFVQSCFS